MWTGELPVLNEKRCTGCGDCVEICPADCLRMRNSLPWLVAPLHCISCTLCVLICPSDALHMDSAGTIPAEDGV